MKLTSGIKFFTLALCSVLSSRPALAAGDDIDIFTGASGGAANNPRILIILDNSANWSRQSQKWLPAGTTQGQAEARAIANVISNMDDSVSVGLMEFGTAGPGDGGFIRSAIKPMNATNKAAFTTTLNTIAGNITGNLEKAGNSVGYGNLMYDAYNYFTGDRATQPASVDTGRSDNEGYVTDPSLFKTPLNSASSCGKLFIIFIGNSQILNTDAPANTTALNLLQPDRTPVTTIPAFNTTTTTTNEIVGTTAACYASTTAAATALSAAPFSTACLDYTNGCKIGVPAARTPACAAGTNAYTVIGTDVLAANVPNGLMTTATGFNSDDWAKFMADQGVPINGTTIRPSVATYTIDVYKRDGNATFTGVLMSMANHGKGKYFLATTEDAITDALETISAEIQAVNSAFASTSLPVNATNRSQNQNQVFIGMFRPDGLRRPRWFGNLKRYELIFDSGKVALGDVNKVPAVNANTGFMTPCARSFWSTDSGNYWEIPIGTTLPLGMPVKGNCPRTGTNTFNLFSDIPDGELVEKGAAAQVLRQGNNGSAAASRVLNRSMKTLGTTSMVSFDKDTLPARSLDATLVNWIRGGDVDNEKHVTPAPAAADAAVLTRPSIHGDVIHSRPQPVTYVIPKPGSTTGEKISSVVIYYGANDGALHAVDAGTGVEKWSFVESEASLKLARLRSNAPLVSYAGQTSAHALLAQPKDYFFDGSIGLYQNAAGAETNEAWIFPSMRRGGRRVYGFDVSDKDAPAFKWKLGCSDAGACDADMTEIGQTWSTPSPAFIKGFSLTKPAVLFGGGYDTCEDTNGRINAECSGLAIKGKTVYIRDSADGTHLASFRSSTPETERSFAADLGFVDVDGDGYVDYAYAADTGGGLWRINFINNPNAKTPLAKDEWAMVKIASMPVAAGRKFLFAPALLYTDKKVYIAIGSGDREHPLESQYGYTSSVQNRFYMFRDDLTDATPAIQNLDALPDGTNATCSTVGALPNQTTKGWYKNLTNGRGEQVVTSALIVGGLIAFSTNRPEPAATGTCSTNLGRAYGYWLNLFSGSGAMNEASTCGSGNSSEFAGGGLPPTPVMATSVPVIRPTGGKDADGNDKTVTEYVTVCFGCAKRTTGTVGSGEGGSPFDPTKVGPTLLPKRKRSYTYSSTD